MVLRRPKTAQIVFILTLGVLLTNENLWAEESNVPVESIPYGYHLEQGGLVPNKLDFSLEGVSISGFCGPVFYSINFQNRNGKRTSKFSVIPESIYYKIVTEANKSKYEVKLEKKEFEGEVYPTTVSCLGDKTDPDKYFLEVGYTNLEFYCNKCNQWAIYDADGKLQSNDLNFSSNRLSYVEVKGTIEE